jgi:hypothetical protein
MSDPTIILRPRTTIVSNGERFITSRGKKEAQLLVAMVAPAVTPATYFFFQKSNRSQDFFPSQQDFSSWSPARIHTILTIYPQDIIAGWDNFLGHGEPPPPFIQERRAAGAIFLTNYGPYYYPQDLLGHRTIDFQVEPPFIQQQRQYLLTALVPAPQVAGDVSGPRLGADVIETYTHIASFKGAWHIVLMPDIAPPPPPPPVLFPYIPNTATVDVRLKHGYQPWRVRKGDVIG